MYLYLSKWVAFALTKLGVCSVQYFVALFCSFIPVSLTCEGIHSNAICLLNFYSWYIFIVFWILSEFCVHLMYMIVLHLLLIWSLWVWLFIENYRYSLVHSRGHIWICWTVIKFYFNKANCIRGREKNSCLFCKNKNSHLYLFLYHPLYRFSFLLTFAPRVVFIVCCGY